MHTRSNAQFADYGILDLHIQIRKDVLEEIDGPILIHGLQDFQGTKIFTPRSSYLKPNPAFLEERFKIFTEAH